VLGTTLKASMMWRVIIKTLAWARPLRRRYGCIPWLVQERDLEAGRTILPNKRSVCGEAHIGM